MRVSIKAVALILHRLELYKRAIRTWRKLHLACDEGSGEILAALVTVTMM
ncbi:MAG: hypothetical protein V7K70_18255 [Nostoc sp.]